MFYWDKTLNKVSKGNIDWHWCCQYFQIYKSYFCWNYILVFIISYCKYTQLNFKYEKKNTVSSSGFEPSTSRLQVIHSTTELCYSDGKIDVLIHALKCHFSPAYKTCLMICKLLKRQSKKLPVEIPYSL